MKTSLPTRENGELAPSDAGSSEYLELCNPDYPQARRVALMSVLPGLGQIRNGETVKGILFLAVTASNIALLCLFIRGIRSQPQIAIGGSSQGAFVPLAYISFFLLVGFIAYAVRDAYQKATEVIRRGATNSRFLLNLPEVTSGSYLLHVLIIAACLFTALYLIKPPPVPTQITNIELVKPEPKPKSKQGEDSKPAAKAEAKRVETPAKPVVQPPKPVVAKQVEPPKPQKITVATPIPLPALAPLKSDAPPAVSSQPPNDSQSSDSNASGAPGGSAKGKSGTGDGQKGSDEVDMGPYMDELKRKIKRAWHPPKGAESARIKVIFRIHKNGSVTNIKLATSSGISMADDAAEEAIESAAPFANLPDGAGDSVDVNFTFDYNVFGRGR